MGVEWPERFVHTALLFWRLKGKYICDDDCYMCYNHWLHLRFSPALAQVMAWCRQATSHDLKQCLPGHGLVPSGNKPWPETMPAKMISGVFGVGKTGILSISVIVYHNWGLPVCIFLSFQWLYIVEAYLHHAVIPVWLLILIHPYVPCCHVIKFVLIVLTMDNQWRC